MDKNKAVILASQTVVFVGLVVLVALGHNSSITDALMAVSGSLIGTGLYTTVKATKAPKAE